jgi:hypothetical protein
VFLQIFDGDFGDRRQAGADTRVGDYDVEGRNAVSKLQVRDGDCNVNFGGAVDLDDNEGTGMAFRESPEGLGSGIVGITNCSNYGSVRSCKVYCEKATTNP